jgi:hypothetical protein
MKARPFFVFLTRGLRKAADTLSAFPLRGEGGSKPYMALLTDEGIIKIVSHIT